MCTHDDYIHLYRVGGSNISIIHTYMSCACDLCV